MIKNDIDKNLEHELEKGNKVHADFTPIGGDYGRINRVYQFLESEGFYVLPDPAGSFSGFSVYKKHKPKIENFDIPKEFKTLRKINSSELLELEESFLRAPFVPSSPVDEGESKEVFKIMKNFFSNRPTNNIVYNYSRIKYGEWIEKYLDNPNFIKQGIAYNPIIGDELPTKFVPRTEWASDILKNSGLTIYDFLTILNKPEADIFALSIGRAVCGRDGNQQPNDEYQLSHTYRIMAMLWGNPGIGKSQLMKKITEALSFLGYEISSYEKSKQFNMGKVATSDLCFTDDLSEKDISGILSSGLTKTLVTSTQKVKVEEKGENDYYVLPNTCLVSCINDFNLTDAWQMDSGMLDRVVLLACKTRIHLNKENNYGNKFLEGSSLFPPNHFDHLLKVLGLENNHENMISLFTYFICLCRDKFLETISGNLYEEVRQLKASLKVNLNNDYSIQVIYSLCFLNNLFLGRYPDEPPDFSFHNWPSTLAKLMSMVSTVEGSLSDDERRDVEKSKLSVLVFLKWHFENVDPENPVHPWIGLSRINYNSIHLAISPFFGGNNGEIASNSKDSVSDIITILKNLKDLSGMHFLRNQVKLIQNYNKMRDYYSYNKKVFEISNTILGWAKTYNQLQVSGKPLLFSNIEKSMGDRLGSNLPNILDKIKKIYEINK